LEEESIRLKKLLEEKEQELQQKDELLKKKFGQQNKNKK
jgi:hypothetical protein